MIKMYTKEKTEEILLNYKGWVDTLAERYHIPAAFIKAILYMEMTGMDIMDIAADAAVSVNVFNKKDSSTGYAQIFGRVGLEAVNFACDRGLTDYAKLRIESDHRLSSKDPEDIRLVWKLLKDDPFMNMEIAVLNMLSCAEEKTGRIAFDSYTEDEMKLIMTRYNADTDHITQYGEDAYQNYLRYLEEEKES